MQANAVAGGTAGHEGRDLTRLWLADEWTTRFFFAMGPGETGFGGGTMTIDKSQLNDGMPGVDLQGYNIEGLDLTGDSFETGQDSGGHDIVDVRMTLVIRGE